MLAVMRMLVVPRSENPQRPLQPAETLRGAEKLGLGARGSALPVSLSTSRMKLLGDCSMDTSPEEDAGKDSGSMEGKGSVEGGPFPLPSLTPPTTCQVHPCALQVTVLFPVHLQARGLCVCVGGGFWHLLGFSGHKTNLEPEEATGRGLDRLPQPGWAPVAPSSPSQGPVPKPWTGREKQLAACWRCSKTWTGPTRTSSGRSGGRWPPVPSGPEGNATGSLGGRVRSHWTCLRVPWPWSLLVAVLYLIDAVTGRLLDIAQFRVL